MTPANVIENARSYADRILKLIEPLQDRDDLSAILFLAYLNGFKEGIKQERGHD